jgi:cytochrome c
VYAVVAYLLSIDGIVEPGAVLDAQSLPKVRMPNRDGFVSWWPKPPR